MNARLRGLTIGILVTALLAAGPAMARQLFKAKSLVCAGSGPQNGQITVTESRGTLTLKFKGEDLVAGQGATCGYTCGMVFTNGPEVPCGTVASNGRLSSTIELPLAFCFGFIPFFNTPTTGKCVASTLP